MGWFSSNKPKVTTKNLKNGTLTVDPFKGLTSYSTKKSIKFHRTGGWLSDFKCDFTIHGVYQKTDEDTSWGLEIQTYRKLKAPNFKKMELLIEAEPLWRQVTDFIVILDKNRIPSSVQQYDFEKKSNDDGTIRESWGSGLVKFSREDLTKIIESNLIAIRYYGGCKKSEFDMDENQTREIKKLMSLLLADATSFETGDQT